jgi:DNA-binding response OmpR family regulator
VTASSALNGKLSESFLKPLVFVVDDEPMIADLVGQFLQLEGIEVRVFHNPLAALAEFRGNNPKPTILISDHRMAGMSGLELIKACKKFHPTLKTISISGTMSSCDMEAVGVAPDRIVRKPFRPSELLPPIWELLGCTQPVPTSLDFNARVLRQQLLLTATGTLAHLVTA